MYKSVYLNYDYETIIILFIFLVYGQFLKEILTKLIRECFRPKNIRFHILFCLSVSVYSHFFGIWAIINYINERDYRFLNSQIFFSLSELIPSYLYYKYLTRFDKATGDPKVIKISVVYTILFISILHIYLASFERVLWEYFVTGFFNSNRFKLRDFSLILNDLNGVIFASFWLYKIKKTENQDLRVYLNK